MWTSLNQKKLQRRVNKAVREFNRGLAEDNLWNGRFYVKQNYCYCRPYRDKSGLEAAFIFTLYDLKTGMTKECCIDGINFEPEFKAWHLYKEMGDFMNNYCKVWENMQELTEDSFIYRTPKGAFDIEQYSFRGRD